MALNGEKRTYICTCTLCSKGNKLVSKATYYAHKAFRLLSADVPLANAAMRGHKNGADSSTPGSSAAGPSSTRPNTPPTYNLDPPDARRDDSDTGTSTQPSILRKRTLGEADYVDERDSLNCIGGEGAGGEEHGQKRGRVGVDGGFHGDEDMDIVGTSFHVLWREIYSFCFFTCAVHTR
jgi:hypothetical protein